jgi:hypothetical protein
MEDTKRPLNMEEKRNLQKLLFSDIETAAAKYAAARKEERDRLKERLVDTAAPEVRGLFDQWKSARETKDRIAKELASLGYSVNDYGDKPLSINDYNKQPHELATFDEESKRTEKRMTDLKRDFTLRLFAGGEEARALFSALSNELGSIQK